MTGSFNNGAYTLVLTHDIDNISLRVHPVFSRMTFAFFKRCLWNNLLRTISRDISMRKYLDSLKWCFLYPLVKIGLVDDPWESVIEDIIKLEKRYGGRSTFFFLPYPNEPGHIESGLPAPAERATRYDISNYRNLLNRIESEGCEVGVHGIDAHISPSNAKRELDIIKELVPSQKRFGLRMHWLYSSEELLKNLKSAGFHYDASYGGSNEIGFINGKYRPFKRDNIWVIPINIHDAVLLGHWRMNLSVGDAWREIEKILEEARKRKAVVTVLWHTNSFTAFCYWGDLYERILKKAKADGARIMRCMELCEELDKCQRQEFVT